VFIIDPRTCRMKVNGASLDYTETLSKRKDDERRFGFSELPKVLYLPPFIKSRVAPVRCVCVCVSGGACTCVQCSIYSRTLKVSYRHILTKGRGTRGCPLVCVCVCVNERLASGPRGIVSRRMWVKAD